MVEPGRYVIVRTKNAGVFAGYIERNIVDRAGTFTGSMRNSRRLWKWEGAFTLDEIATKGPTKPQACKFSAPTEHREFAEGIEILIATEQARAVIQGIVAWEG